jgi:hypothetical protein
VHSLHLITTRQHTERVSGIGADKGKNVQPCVLLNYRTAWAVADRIFIVLKRRIFAALVPRVP